MKLKFQDEKEYTKAEVEAALAAALYRYNDLLKIDEHFVEVYEDIYKWQSRLNQFNETTTI